MQFSIVIPAYNEAAYLDATLISLRQQDYDGTYEVIVVDNNSTDDTALVAARHGVRVEFEAQRGVGAARQRGCTVALGAVIVSADADTVYPVDWLRTLDRALAEAPDSVAVAGPCRYAGARWWMRAFPAALFTLVDALTVLTGRVLYVSATNLAIRREAFPGYDLTLTQGGDELDLLRRLRRQGPVVWDRSNVVLTSSRRFDRGLLYHLVVSLAVYYLLAYALNRLTGRPTIGTAPAVRGGPAPRHHTALARR